MSTITEFQSRLEQAGYVSEPGLAATLLLFTELRRPLLVEGEAGVGKTEIAKALAAVFACSVTKAWTPARRFTNGIISGNCSLSRFRRANTPRLKRKSVISSTRTSCSNVRCCRPLLSPNRRCC